MPRFVVDDTTRHRHESERIQLLNYESSWSTVRYSTWSTLFLMVENQGFMRRCSKDLANQRAEFRTRRQPILSQKRATTMGSTQTVRETLLIIVHNMPKCELGDLVTACPQFTWNQICWEIDRLSRTGEVQMTHHHFGPYRLTVSPSAAPHGVRVARVVASVSAESQWPTLPNIERTLHEHGSTLTGRTEEKDGSLRVLTFQ